MITGPQLSAFAPAADAATFAPLLGAGFAKAGLLTPMRIAHFLAQAAVESMYFQRFEEDLDYTAARILAVWPQRFSETTATDYAHKPQALADWAYANRLGNGGPASGDGWRYRGRGLFQTTGRANYAEAERLTHLPLTAQPDLLLLPANAVASAVAYWGARDCNFLADRDDLAGITRAVTGGMTGLALRQRAFSRARTIWS